jgi:hypothetical protein
MCCRTTSSRGINEEEEFFFVQKVTAQLLLLPLWGRAGVGAVPRRRANREAGKHFFFEKKEAKNF